MARQKGIIKVTGKMKHLGITFVERNGEIHARRLPTVKTEKSSEFKEHSKCSQSVNILAGQINRILGEYAPLNRGLRMYYALQSRLKKVRPATRLPRLMALIGLDSHSIKTISSLSLGEDIRVQEEGRRLRVAIDYSAHVKMPKNHHFYHLETVVAYWVAIGEDPLSLAQHTKWIEPADKLKGYDMFFELPENCLDYIVLFRCRIAQEKGTKRLPPNDYLKVIHAGSFDAAAAAEWKAFLDDQKNAPKKPLTDWSEEDDGVEGR